MTTTRQDAWTQDEDLLLAEIVLRHIREGETQLAAFEEVGRRLSRTAAACGFRWNSHVRKQYKTGIELAKKQRKELRKAPHEEELQGESVNFKIQEEQQVKQGDNSKNTIKELISFLQQYENAPTIQEVEKENKRLKETIIELDGKLAKLEQEKSALAKNLEVMEEDYQALIEIMDRARKMVILQGDERNRKVKFQMDKNGNLERVEK